MNRLEDRIRDHDIVQYILAEGIRRTRLEKIILGFGDILRAGLYAGGNSC